MRKFGLRIKIIVLTFLLVVFTTGILIYFSYRTAYLDLESAIAKRLEAIAATGALLINGDLHDQIKTPADAHSETFKQLQKVLRNIKRSNNLKEDIYTFRLEGGKLKYIIMSHAKPFIGDTGDIRPEMWPAFNHGTTSVTKVFSDEHGIWLSAYAPIRDSDSHISGILNVSIELTTFQAELQKKVSSLAIISAIILVSALLLSFLLSRGVVRKLRYLGDITREITTGMMDRSISIKSRDEVGELAESLERMRISLKMAMEMIAEKEEEEEKKS